MLLLFLMLLLLLTLLSALINYQQNISSDYEKANWSLKFSMNFVKIGPTLNCNNDC